MKKQKIFNFALTTMCVAVLSACGSSGGGSLAVENTPTTPSANANANTGADNSAALAAAQKAAEEAAAKQAAAEETAKKAQAEADKAKADAANTLNDAAANLSKALEEARQQGKNELLAEQEEEAKKQKAQEEEAKKLADAEKAKLAEALKAQPFGNKDMLQNTPVKEGNSFVGFKHVVKNNSNLATNSSVDKDSTSDIPTMMGIQNPQRSLDNIVVAEPLQKEAGAPRTYLEDFDTRTLSTSAWKDLNGIPHEGGTPANNSALLHAEKKQAPTKGKMADYSIGNTALQNIYINSITVKGGKTGPGYDTAIEVERAKLADVKSKADDKLKKLNNAFDKANKAVEDFEATLGGHLSAVGADKPIIAYTANGYTEETKRLREIITSNNAAISVTDKELAQQELDVLLKKHNQLSEAAAKAKAPIADQEVVAENAKNALNKFNAENPAPDAEKLSEVGQARRSGFGVILNPNGQGNALYETKTDTMGRKIGAIWNFSATDIQNRHQNFTEHNLSLLNSNSPNVVTEGFVVHEKRDLNGNLRVNQYKIAPIVNAGDTVKNDQGDVVKPEQALGLRTQDYSVAEIYGYRSKAAGSYDKPLDTVDNLVEPKDNKTPANNLPLVNDYKGARLQHVQYGRVTSALSDRTSTDDFYKTGVRMNDVTKTYVASFGEYGADGTENHFFFRGIDNVGGVGGTTLAKLKEDTKNGVITYEGHAVTYGLNNNFMGNREIPTALGNGSGFVSGNHAKAAVNLATNAVTGSIFNKWYDPASPKALRDIDLVQFKGTIADNGNIAGDAVRVDNQTTGLFGAALYGAGAEMGGTVASHDKAAGKHWGGVFGAIRTGVEEAPKKSPQDGLAADGKI